MDTNAILKHYGYGNHTDFVKIAQEVALIEWRNEVQMLNHVEQKYGPADRKIEMLQQCQPGKLFLSDKLPVDHGALDQLYTALKLPVALQGAAMPDLHLGYSLPIGGVVALDRAISPGFVGFDIGCQVHLTTYITDSPHYEEHIDADRFKARAMDAILRSTSFGLGAKMGFDYGPTDNVMRDPLWRNVPILKQNFNLACEQLGSSGGGNHFTDFVQVNYKSGRTLVGLMTHSGSRGIGNKVGHYYAKLAEEETAKKYKVPKGYGWFDIDSPLGKEYLAVMRLLVRYASACHQIIQYKFQRLTNLLIFSHVSSVHNTAEVAGGVVVHRKGAISAQGDELGVIPGSSGTLSYLVRGLGNQGSLWSASHGAGRPFSRTKAKQLHDPQSFADRMNQLGILYHGVDTDETYQAYKNIEDVIDAQRDLVEVIATISPKAVVMGGKSDDGD